MPTSIVPAIPIPHPEFEKASGPASKPEPKDDLIMLAVARISLIRETLFFHLRILK